MSDFDNKGKMALWDRREGASEKAPVLKGEAYAHRDIKAGERLSVALWQGEGYTKGGNKPRLKGKLGDWNQGGATSEAPKLESSADLPVLDDFAEGVPF